MQYLPRELFDPGSLRGASALAVVFVAAAAILGALVKRMERQVERRVVPELRSRRKIDLLPGKLEP